MATVAPSPCLRCVDTDAPCPCSAYLHWWQLTNPEPPADPGCATCEETEFLLLAGEDFAAVAARAGRRPMTPRSLERHLLRHQRNDLIPTGWRQFA
jgi:hypothetical protein